MLERLRTRLREDTGTALIDAMVGIIISAIAIMGLAGIAAATSTAVIASNDRTSRLSFLRSYVNEISVGSSAVPPAASPQTKTVALGSKNVSVTSWTTTSGAATVFHAALASDHATTAMAEACAAPMTTAPASCLRVQVNVSPVGAGFVTTPVSASFGDSMLSTASGGPASAGAVGSFTPSSSSTEIRFVLELSATDAGSLTFADSITNSVIKTIPFAANFNGYLYGSIPVAGANNVNITLTGSNAFISRFYLYEAPK